MSDRTDAERFVRLLHPGATCCLVRNPDDSGEYRVYTNALAQRPVGLGATRKAAWEDAKVWADENERLRWIKVKTLAKETHDGRADVETSES